MKHIIHILALLIAFVGVTACVPELRGRSCTDQTDCLTTEICNLEQRVCLPRSTDVTVDSDAVVDTADDPIDVDPNDVIDADASDALDEDADIDVCTELREFDHSARIWLYEPCAVDAPGGPAECHSRASANENGASTWQRGREPVEIALVNGILDHLLVNYWTFDNELAGYWDGSFLTHGGGSPLFTAGFDGTANGAVFLDETRNLSIGPTNFLENASEWTVMLTVKPDVLPQDDERRHLFYYDDNSTNHGAIEISFDATSMRFRVGSSPTDYMIGDATSVELSDIWTHVALSMPLRPASSFSGVFPIAYVDGRPVEVSWQVLGAPSSRLPIAGPCHVGQGPSSDTATAAAFDELLIFRRALTPNEIAAYVSSLSPFATKFTGVLQTQADFDDLIVTQESLPSGTEERIDFEIVGVRPHSNLNLQGVAAYWNLDGAVLHDVTNNTNPVSTGSSSVLGRFGDRLGARQFEPGEIDYIDTQFMPTLDPSDPFTFELWVAASTAGDFFGFDNTENGSQVGMTFVDRLDFGAGIQVDISDIDSSAVRLAFDQANLLGQWHHYAVVRDGNRFELYIDGARVSSLLAALDNEIDAGIMSVNIGRINGLSDSTGFAGIVDEVLVHNRALSAEEIRRRAQPLLPTLRFFAETDEVADSNGTWPYLRYRLYWGHSDEYYSEPLVDNPVGGESCLGLLSTCNGYLGWWRFDEGHRTAGLTTRTGTPLLTDSSTSNRHANLLNSSQRIWEPGIDGTALYLDGARAVASLDEVDLSWGFTLEVVAQRSERELSKAQPMAVLGDGIECDVAQLNLSDMGEYDQLSFSYHLESGLCLSSATYSTTNLIDAGWHLLGVAHQSETDLTSLSINNHTVEGAWVGGSGSEPVGDWLTSLVIGSHPQAPTFYDTFSGRIDSVRLMSLMVPTEQQLHVPATLGRVLNNDSGGCLDE